MTRLVCVGECMVELSPAAEGTFRRGFAGDTFNTAWYLRKLMPLDGNTVAYLTDVGDDPMSRELMAFVEAAGIETSLIRMQPGGTPGLYLITLDGHERSFTYWRDTSAARRLADDEERLGEAFAQADLVYTSGITLGILQPDARARLLDALREAREAGREIAFDPNIRERLWSDRETLRGGIEAGARAATIALPSFDDEARIFGDADPEATARRYLALGVREVVVKDGPGSVLVMGADGTRVAVEATRVDTPLDTTGAGDSFGAAYLAARLKGADPEAAVRRGHAVAAQVIQGYGALVEIGSAAD